jgi:hypothetical protein
MWMLLKVFRCPKTQNDYNFKVKLSECLKTNDQNWVQVYAIDSKLPNKTSKKNFPLQVCGFKKSYFSQKL